MERAWFTKDVELEGKLSIRGPAAGSASIPPGIASFTVLNPQCKAGDKIFADIATDDPTAIKRSVVPLPGGFVFNLIPATNPFIINYLCLGN